MKRLLPTIAAILAVASMGRGDVPHGTYAGTSATLVKYLNPDTLQTQSQESFSRKVIVFIGDPKSASNGTESNPFTLSVSPRRRGSSPTPGEIFAASARIFPISGTPSLFQYWTLQNTATGFTGALTNNYIESGLAKDRVIANLGGPGGNPAKFKMHDARIAPGLQCSLDAVVEGDQMTLKIRGYAYVPEQAIIHFNTKINALKQAASGPGLEPRDE